jgi:hypothetical protein
MINKDKKKLIPTGNVDVIEIKCDKDDTCKVKPQEPDENNTEPVNKIDDDYSEMDNLIIDKNDKPDDANKQKNDNKKEEKQDSNKEKNTKPEEKQENNQKPNEENNNDDEPVIPSDNEPEPEPEELIVKDEEIRWVGSTDAKIFLSSMYELGDKIAPESSNVYQFIVRNGTFYNLKYEVNFVESNPYNINMKYKLKKNDTYIIDHYVSASELNISNILLDSKTNDTYYLEWKWISSENDTEIGTNPDATYELKIEIKAESVNE